MDVNNDMNLEAILADLQLFQAAPPHVDHTLIIRNKSAMQKRPGRLETTYIPQPGLDSSGTLELKTVVAKFDNINTISLNANNSDIKTNISSTSEEIRRAKTILALAEMRDKFRQTGDTGLIRAKQRVDVIASKYSIPHMDEPANGSYSVWSE